MNNETLLSLLSEGDHNVHLPQMSAPILQEQARALELVNAAEQAAAVGTHGEYFRVSRERYATYIALSMAYLRVPSRILDVGNAPGHVAFLLNRMGHDVFGLNLNSEWRSTYPDKRWLDLFHVMECDIEKEELPYEFGTFDAVVFTEVLEHIAIANPELVLRKLRAVLKPDGVMLFSTPNVCNISNIIALTRGLNIFWAPPVFYGSLDRHNREWTPAEVKRAFIDAGFRAVEFFGMNCHSNWRTGASDEAYRIVQEYGEGHSMLRNTIVGVFARCD